MMGINKHITPIHLGRTMQSQHKKTYGDFMRYEKFVVS